MGVIDGQDVSAAVTNPAFLDQNQDDVMHGILGMDNAQPASGAVLGNVQGLMNHLKDTTGATEIADGTNYSSNNVIPDGMNHQDALSAFDAKFHATTGHKHTGVAGDAPPISGANVSGVPLVGRFVQGTDLAGITGTSTNVTGTMGGEVASAGSTSEGVVVTAPQNKVVLRQASGTDIGDEFKDADGNVVYGRLTFAAGVWTLSYYVLIGAVETAYNFTVAADIRWYRQKLFNPMTNAPVYSELAEIPSDNPTADVVTATATIQGKVSTPVATATDVAAATSGGTANGQVAPYDHAHKGTRSIAKSAGDTTQVFGDVTWEEGSGITITRTGNKFRIDGAGGTAGQDETTALITATPYSAVFTDKVLFVDASAGNKVINLPSILTNVGKRLRIMKIDSSANTVTINRASTDVFRLFTDDTSIVLGQKGEAVTMITFDDGVTKFWGVFA